MVFFQGTGNGGEGRGLPEPCLPCFSCARVPSQKPSTDTHRTSHQPGFELMETVAFNGNADRPLSRAARMAPMVINMRSDSQVEDRQIVTQLLQKQQDRIQKKKKKVERKEIK